MSRVLEELLAHARARADSLPRLPPRRPERPPFAPRIAGRDRVAVIAEFKRCSPSSGLLAGAADLRARVRSYARAGAAAVSVLTEDSRFGGSHADLAAAAAVLRDTPLLMKDFVVDPRQVELARTLGASAVLLIARCLGPALMAELVAACAAHGLTPLIECHDHTDLQQALRHPGAVLGINNRDLDTLAVDTRRADALLPSVPPGRIVVAESGYDSPTAVRTLRGRADAALVGTALMRQPDPTAFLREACA